MYTVSVPQQCGCVKRSDHKLYASYEDKDNALMQANKMAKDMNTNFCGKHAFVVREDGDNFIVAMASDS